MEIADIVVLYVEIIREALPITVVFWFGNMIVSTFLSAAFGGKLSFKV